VAVVMGSAIVFPCARIIRGARWLTGSGPVAWYLSSLASGYAEGFAVDLPPGVLPRQLCRDMTRHGVDQRALHFRESNRIVITPITKTADAP